MAATQHPVRRCSPCDENWPATAAYNLCPRCQRNTYASTDEVVPMASAAATRAAKYAKYREFDAQCDAGTLQFVDAGWIAEMNALLELTPSIPDPEPTPPGPGPDYNKPFKRWGTNDA